MHREEGRQQEKKRYKRKRRERCKRRENEIEGIKPIMLTTSFHMFAMLLLLSESLWFIVLFITIVRREEG